MGVRCAAKGCKNCMKNDNHYMYHRFPSMKDRCIEWLKACGRHDLLNTPVESVYRNFRICSVHFEPKMYSNPEKTRLLPQAMPTLFINTHVTQEIDVIDENSLATTADRSTCSTVSTTSSQTIQKLSVNTPRKKKLKTEVSLLKAKCAKLEKQVETLSLKVVESIHSVGHFKEVCDAHFPPNLSMIIKNFVNLTKKNPL
ncbi:hypothetical protein QTP88_017135 [Uroleucon formosanum]